MNNFIPIEKDIKFDNKIISFIENELRDSGLNEAIMEYDDGKSFYVKVFGF